MESIIQSLIHSFSQVASFIQSVKGRNENIQSDAKRQFKRNSKYIVDYNKTVSDRLPSQRAHTS
jgi:hypothetical protein